MNALNRDCLEQSTSQSEHPKLTSPSYTFSKSLRLLCSADYSSVFSDAPIRASHTHFLILARSNTLGHPRLGLIVAKKHVRKAHDRNLIKRMCRESFRQQQHNLPAIDAIVLARRGADSVSPADITATLNGLWKRIIKRTPNSTT